MNFSSLYEQKRSQDPEAVARRQSINEQKDASSGMLGKMFKKYGNSPGSNFVFLRDGATNYRPQYC